MPAINARAIQVEALEIRKQRRGGMRLRSRADSKEFFSIVRVTNRLAELHRGKPNATAVKMFVEKTRLRSRAKRQPHAATAFRVVLKLVDVRGRQWTSVRENDAAEGLQV